VQSNQILGSSNEATMYYQQMRRSIAGAIMNRLASTQVTDIINHEFEPPKRNHP
jgi:outer membrane lipopolysaccharide assembly protein LptE/RlpB